MDASTREQLKLQHQGEKLHFIKSVEDGIEVVVTAAPPATWLKYRSMVLNATDPVQRALAAEFLVLGSTVWPEREQLRQDLEGRKKTGFYAVAVQHIAELTGVRENLVVGEL